MNFETEFLKLLYGAIPIEGHLKIANDDDLDIGLFETNPDELKRLVLDSEPALDFLIDQYNQKLISRQKELTDFESRFPQKLKERFKYNFERKRKSLQPLSKITESRSNYLAPLSPYDESKNSLSQFEANLSRYKQETVARLGSEAFFFKTFKVLFPFSNRQKHTYIIGGSGSGKTELLKVFIHHDTLNKCGSLVIDPHGDLVKDCGRFRREKTEIIYISAEFGKLDLYPKYNPFEHNFHGKPAAEKQAYISVKSQELMNAFEVVMATEFSQNMRRIIFNILQVLLNTEGMNLKDFIHFLRPATSEHYEKLATLHYDENVRLFFAHDFNLKTLSVTKQSVLTRFENALSNYHLAKIFDCKKSSFDLKGLLDQGKCVLVNCSQGLLGEYGSKILGSFLVSEITTHALQRAVVPPMHRKPIMLYIDECQNFLTERTDKILAEARKYGLHLTLANQYLNQIDNLRLRSSILANTNVKCCGHTSAKDFETMSKEMGYESRKSPKLGHGRFIVKVGTYKPVLLQAYDFLIKKSSASYLNKEKHRARLNHILNHYYRKVSATSDTSPADRSNPGLTPHIPNQVLPLPKPEKLL